MPRQLNTKSSLLAERAGSLSATIAWWVDRICALLMVLLVLDVWLGIFARRIGNLDITFTEELARYLMIWMALLAVSSGIAYREHIGMRLVIDLFPESAQSIAALMIDVLALCFFVVLFYYGLGMAADGARSFTMIFGISKAWPFAAVPIAAALACIQLVLVCLRDQAHYRHGRGMAT
ncbi:MAG: TRAP transporter small permease [Granulosicoccus sp.]|nr:TRAP transporter small permease [Granulosicoccus sp.]